MTIYDDQEWYDIPPTIETYYRDRYKCDCAGKKCLLDIDSDKHGTKSGYNRHNCRCGDCTQARSDYNKSRSELSLPEDDLRHGTLNAYSNWGCRCDLCKAAGNAEFERRKEYNLPEDDARHGQVASYTILGCRCNSCKKTFYTYQNERRRVRSMASKWYEASADDDFGISKREQSEMVGRAMGEHIWDKMEDIFAPGGFKLQQQQHTISEFEKRFPNHPIKIEEDDDPYVSHKVGDWDGRYYNGPYIDLHHKKYGPMEVINLQNADGKTHKLKQDEFRLEVENFVKNDAQQYVDNEEYNNRTSSKWYHESSNGKCLSCGVLVSNPMNTYCPVCQDIMAQGDSDAYMQLNPRHPEARPLQKPHDYSGNE